MQKIFGISLRKREKDDEVEKLSNENAELKNANLKLNIEMMRLKKTISEVFDICMSFNSHKKLCPVIDIYKDLFSIHHT